MPDDGDKKPPATNITNQVTDVERRGQPAQDPERLLKAKYAQENARRERPEGGKK